MMEGATLSVFQHDPLPDAKTHIRLLEILQGEFGQRVVCNLSAWPIDNAPPYYAISYTWGDPGSTANVTINGKQMVVRRNCEYVLQQACSSRACQYFWVDAICIDQEGVQEKNVQVAMMGQVYNRATYVFACVGPHSDDSEFIMKTFKRREPLFTEIYSKTGRKWSQVNSWHVSSTNPIPMHSWLALRCFFLFDTEIKRRLVHAFFAFWKRPYFTRVWILQELHQASHLFYCCGTDICSADDLRACTFLMTFWLTPYFLGSSRIIWIRKYWQRLFFRRKMTYGNLDILAFDIETELFTLRLVSQSQHLRPLYEIMARIDHFHSADVRDKLYGIMSIVDWKGVAPIPDYAKDSFELATEVLRITLTDSESGRYFASDLKWIRYIWTIFEVSSAQETMRKAIEARHEPSKAIPTLAGSQNSKRLGFVREWVGTQIHDLGSRRETNQPVRSQRKQWSSRDVQSQHNSQVQCSERLPDQPFVQLFDNEGVVFAYAPPDTRAGDWYLEFHGELDVLLQWRYAGLIVRHAKRGRYNIIGPNLKVDTNKLNIFDRIQGPSLFRILWNAEDAIILDWSCTHTQVDGHSHKKIIEFVNLRVCGEQGSSYAVRREEEDGAEESVVDIEEELFKGTEER